MNQKTTTRDLRGGMYRISKGESLRDFAKRMAKLADEEESSIGPTPIPTEEQLKTMPLSVIVSFGITVDGLDEAHKLLHEMHKAIHEMPLYERIADDCCYGPELQIVDPENVPDRPRHKTWLIEDYDLTTNVPELYR